MWVADMDITLCQAVFYTVVAQVEAIVEPDCVGGDVWWESVAFVSIHPPILTIRVVNLAYMNHPLLQVDYRWFL